MVFLFVWETRSNIRSLFFNRVCEHLFNFGGIYHEKNKSIYLFGALLVLVVIGALFFNQSGDKNKETNATNTASTQTETVKIGVLQLLSHPALDQIYKGLEDGLKKEGYEVGKNLKIDLQNAQGDQSNLASMGQKLVTDNNDILVGITTPATLSLSNATKDKPIIMGGITYPVEAGLIKAEDKPGNNITGVSDRTPIKQQLEIMKKVLPNMKKVGILYTASEDNSVKQAQEAEKLAKELGLEVKVSTVANTNDIQQVTESLASQTDAIFCSNLITQSLVQWQQ